MQKMEEWLANPSLMSADADAQYAAVIEIDLAEVSDKLSAAPMIQMMLDCCQVTGAKIDEIFTVPA